MSKSKNEPRFSSHSKIAKVIAISIVIFGLSALFLAELSGSQRNELGYKSNANRYIYENLSVTFLIISMLCAITLKQIQKSVYWMYWLKFDKTVPDERQVRVRNKVFARAYGLLIFLIIIALNTLSENNPTQMVWFVIILAISLPSILAAWEKDS